MDLSLQKCKWMISEQIESKPAEDSIIDSDEYSPDSLNSFQYSENTESLPDRVSCLDFSLLLTYDEQPLEKTKALTSRDLHPNVHKSLSNYKNQAATKLQRFFRQRKLNKAITTLFRKFSSISRSRSCRISYNLLKFWGIRRNRAATVIANAWKRYQITTSSNLSSPMRRLLVRAVTVGGALKKVQYVIDSFIGRRTPSPDSKMKSQGNPRSNMSCVNLYSSMFSEGSDTNETISSLQLAEIPNKMSKGSSLEVSAYDLEIYNEKSKDPELDAIPVRVRTKRSMETKVQNEPEHAKSKKVSTETCIPQLRQDSEFWRFSNFSEMKKRLECEYKELIKK